MGTVELAGQGVLPFVEWGTQAGGTSTESIGSGPDFLYERTLTPEARSTNRGSMRVRPFTDNDIDAIIDCGRAMHAESRYRHLSFNPDKVRRHIEQVKQWPTGNWCGYVVVDDDDTVQGVIGGYVKDLLWSDDLVTYDFVLFVRPSARGTLAWKKLVQAYVDWARQFKPKEIIIGVSSGLAHARTGCLYTLMGFSPLAETYVMQGDV